jgi:hypothetical protein
VDHEPVRLEYGYKRRNFRDITFDLTVPPDVAIVPDFQLVRSPQHDIATGVEAATDLVAAPPDVDQIRISDAFQNSDELGRESFHLH